MHGRLSVLFMLAMAPAFAEARDDAYCQEHWFTRNAIFDRAGYCFGSALGQSVFDNSDCTGKNMMLDNRAKAQLAQIKEFEVRAGCKVDTAAKTLDFPGLKERARLTDQPIRDELESACIGWQGEDLALHAGSSAQKPVIGRLQKGDVIGLSHLPENGWTYVIASHQDTGQIRASGWIKDTIDACDAFAG